MDKKILQILKEFESALEEIGIRVERMILYGSYATGKAREGSDIDVAVISKDFEGMNLLERLETIGLALAKARIMEPIEAIGYTQEEFNSKGKGTFIGDEVKTKGIEVI
ncbi:MAG: nucleotidyltransferase domain-containing protein [Candidatus Aminicenantia bacterium]